MRRLAFLAALLFAASAAAAGTFSAERPVTPAAPGPNRLDVDSVLLVGSAPVRHVPVAGRDGRRALAFQAGLEDVRLFDASGREVPYLLIAPEPPAERWRDARLASIASTKVRSGFEADLGSPLRVDRLRVEGLPVPFLKRFLLEGSGDRVRWTVLVAEGTLFDLPHEGLARTEVEFAAEDIRYLRVTWDDRSSGRVPVPRTVSARLAESAEPAPPLLTAIRFERLASEPGRSRFRLRLPGTNLPVRALELSAGKRPLLREARVSEPRLVGGEVVPHPLGAGALRQAVQGGTTVSDLRIPIQPPSGAELDLVVDDGDNPPLDLTGVAAEMGPLPWVYFEAADREPLLARWGQEGLAAPRYDLEARRESAARSSPPRAVWGERRGAKDAAASPTAAVPSAGAALDVREFSFGRPLTGLTAGLNAVALDAAVLAHGSLASLRIVDAGGLQVPYLLERREEPLSVDLPALERIEEKGPKGSVSAYRVIFPFASLPRARLVLSTTARVFERTVSLTVEREDRGRDGARTETVARAVWRHADAETPAPSLVLDVPTFPAVEARLAIDEGDNSPLPLAPPRLLFPSYRVRFFGSAGSDLRLVYGAGVAAPRYDLALLAPRLLGAPAHEAVPGPEARNASAGARGAIPRALFWGALVAAVVALLALLARLVSGRS